MRDSVFRKVSIVFFVWLGFYCLGMLLCRMTKLEYRMWVWIVGNVSLFLLFPLWLFVFWYRRHAKRERPRFLRYFITVVFTVLFLLWSYHCFIGMVFTVQEERKLFGEYVAVNQAAPLSASYYNLYRSKAFFFREKAIWDTDFEIEYLERKYGQEFLEVPFDKDNMLFYDQQYSAVYGETVPVSPAHQNLPVNVSLGKGILHDDYVRVMTDWYVMEGCRTLGIRRPFAEEKGWGFRLYFSGREDVEEAAADIQKLIGYAVQDEIFQSYTGTIQLSPENAEGHEYISISFGGADAQGKMKNGYERDLPLLTQYIEEKYNWILERREAARKAEEEYKKPLEESEPEERKEVSESMGVEGSEYDESDESWESEYAENARSIYEKVIAPENIGEKFEVEYNARGEEYYSLGEDGAYSYTLIYDRDSENGACSLYVLYRSPYDEKNSNYYHYTDTMTQIMDIYAVVKETGEIISSGRKAWSDLGNERYRKAVGE